MICLYTLFEIRGTTKKSKDKKTKVLGRRQDEEMEPSSPFKKKTNKRNTNVNVLIGIQVVVEKLKKKLCIVFGVSRDN